MRLAVIDMGTNTFNLLITEVTNTEFKVLYSTKDPVKLGQKTQGQHSIDANKINTILSTLTNYLNEIEKYRVDKKIVVATSSIRTAKNQKEIVDTVKAKLGIDIQVIDGEREAELIYHANRHAIKMNTEEHLIMDIGGGSTEFIIANSEQIFWKKSFLLGMARLMDEIHPHDPIQPSDIKTVFSYLDQALYPLKETIATYHPKILVGSSGVFDSLVEMIEANIRPLHKTQSSCEITIEDFYTIYHQLLPLSYAERLTFKGLIEMRADMIIMSLLLIDYVLKNYKLEKLKVSFYSLKEGVVLEEMRRIFS